MLKLQKNKTMAQLFTFKSGICSKGIELRKDTEDHYVFLGNISEPREIGRIYLSHNPTPKIELIKGKDYLLEAEIKEIKRHGMDIPTFAKSEKHKESKILLIKHKDWARISGSRIKYLYGNAYRLLEIFPEAKVEIRYKDENEVAQKKVISFED